MDRSTVLIRPEDARKQPGIWLGAIRERASAVLQHVTGTDFEEKIRRLEAYRGHERMDSFGLDLEWVRVALVAVAVLHRFYFRVDASGLENVPAGRVLLIANHSGQLPIDAALVAASMFFDAEPPRVVRSMVDKWTQTLPGVCTLFARCGQVVGVPENAKKLLDSEEALLVFPEGTTGISKPFSERYRLKDFGLGFMRLALETRTPIVPIAVLGAEEQYINVGNLETLAKALRMPVFPIIPQWLLPGGLLPLPTKYRIRFGQPLMMTGDPDDEDAVIEPKVEIVRSAIQSMLNRGIK
ncbi:MAG TPA: lysophospholipid acyltransferase family protein, partial [Polyangiaceae bacterium]|nr:lysophospholipid acyltransferase family protein [Polyangiaceae bacterium]